MERPSRREHAALEPALFGAALLAYAAALPLGLDRVAAGAVVARGVLVGGPEPAAAPLAVLAARALAYLPAGDLATRVSLASALAGALAVALLGRLACDALALTRPPPEARRPPRAPVIEPVAAAGGAAVAGLSLILFRSATGAGGAALALALVAGAFTLALRLARAPQDARAGAALALLCGLAAGVEPGTVLLVWPPGVVLWLRSLRRGERWPLVAPLLFTAGLGSVLAGIAVTHGPVSAAALARAVWPGPAAEPPPLVDIGEQIGVVGLLLAGSGLLVLAARAPAACALVLWGLAAGGWAGGPALLAVAALAAVPIAAGIAHLAGKLGQARLPAAATLAVIAAVSPALDGGLSRWTQDARLPARLLERALDGAPPRASVDPGTAEMQALLRYGAAVGMRPDLAAPVPR